MLWQITIYGVKGNVAHMLVSNGLLDATLDRVMRSPDVLIATAQSLDAPVSVELTVVLAILLLCGCQTVRPIAELSHTSRLTQHFGANRGNDGYNTASVGIRWRPMRGATVDVLEGYSPEDTASGRHEIFNARVQIEW